jgi:hypothetical protein
MTMHNLINVKHKKNWLRTTTVYLNNLGSTKVDDRNDFQVETIV